MPMVQMNTRIDRDLKQRGDAALAQAGFSPSEAVRALWEFAAAHRHEPQTVAQILSIEDLYERKERQRLIDERKNAIRTSIESTREAIIKLNITPEAMKEVAEMSDDELYEQELIERYKERGLW